MTCVVTLSGLEHNSMNIKISCVKWSRKRYLKTILTLVELPWLWLILVFLLSTELAYHQFPAVRGSVVGYAHEVRPNQSYQHNTVF